MSEMIHPEISSAWVHEQDLNNDSNGHAKTEGEDSQASILFKEQQECWELGMVLPPQLSNTNKSVREHTHTGKVRQAKQPFSCFQKHTNRWMDGFNKEKGVTHLRTGWYEGGKGGNNVNMISQY